MLAFPLSIPSLFCHSLFLSLDFVDGCQAAGVYKKIRPRAGTTDRVGVGLDEFGCVQRWPGKETAGSGEREGG